MQENYETQSTVVFFHCKTCKPYHEHDCVLYTRTQEHSSNRRIVHWLNLNILYANKQFHWPTTIRQIQFFSSARMQAHSNCAAIQCAGWAPFRGQLPTSALFFTSSLSCASHTDKRNVQSWLSCENDALRSAQLKRRKNESIMCLRKAAPYNCHMDTQ